MYKYTYILSGVCFCFTCEWEAQSWWQGREKHHRDLEYADSSRLCKDRRTCRWYCVGFPLLRPRISRRTASPPATAPFLSPQLPNSSLGGSDRLNQRQTTATHRLPMFSCIWPCVYNWPWRNNFDWLQLIELGYRWVGLYRWSNLSTLVCWSFIILVIWFHCVCVLQQVTIVILIVGTPIYSYWKYVRCEASIDTDLIQECLQIININWFHLKESLVN